MSEARPRERGAATGAPRRRRLPGFISDDDAGMGDVVKRATSAVGIRPCGGCQERARRLNAWISFSQWR
jgi:hypothetical protein